MEPPFSLRYQLNWGGSQFFLWWRTPQQMLRTHRSLEVYCATLWWRWIVFRNGAPVEWNLQGKAEVLGEKPVPVPLCLPQSPHVLTRDRTRASAVRDWRLTASAIARHRIPGFVSERLRKRICVKCVFCSFSYFYLRYSSSLVTERSPVRLCFI
jgi:hypothetical protein